MPVDPNNPNFRVSEDNLALVNKKEREGRLGSGLSASWTTPESELEKIVPADKLELIRKSQAAHPLREVKETFTVRQSPKLVTIPKAAMGSFKRLLPLFEAVQVNLSTDQSRMLLESLQAMPTPKNMMDAKSIFNLMEALQ